MSNLATYDYTPYGDILQQSGLPLDVGFTGHHWDNPIQQYFAPFRFYAPETMRWNMRDPLGYIDGPNMYAYVGGNPVMYVDPDGRFLVVPVAVVAVAGGIIGGFTGAVEQVAKGCGKGSILKGASLGAAVGAIVGGFSVASPHAAIIYSGAGGTINGYLREGTEGIAPGLIGGLVFGAIPSGMAFRYGKEGMLDFGGPLAALNASMWVSNASTAPTHLKKTSIKKCL